MTFKKSPVDIFSREKVVAQVLLLIVLGCLVFFARLSFKSSDKSNDKSSDVSTAYLELQINGQRRAFEGSVSEDMTLLDALYIASKVGNIEFQYTPQPQTGANILQIAGLKQNDYAIYLNGTTVPLNQLDSKKLNTNDSVVVKTIKTNP